MSRLVVDASVAVKWFAPEIHSAAAAAVLDGPYDLCVPDLLYPEAGNVFWKKVKRGEMTAAEAAEAVDALLRLPVEVFPVGPLVPAALQLGLSTGSTVYDSVYVCLAASMRAPFVTADRRLANVQARGPLARWVRFIDELGEPK